MKTLGNIIWLIFGGILVFIEYLVSSLLLCVTIIGIPFGLQTLKLALLALWPFGQEVIDNGNSGGCLSVIMNVIWICVGGIWICLTHLFFGVLLCITIVGIPFGRQHFKMAALRWPHSPSLLSGKPSDKGGGLLLWSTSISPSGTPPLELVEHLH